MYICAVRVYFFHHVLKQVREWPVSYVVEKCRSAH